MDGYLTQKDGIAHSLTNFLMNVPILRHPQTLFIGLAADDDLSEHVLSGPLAGQLSSSLLSSQPGPGGPGWPASLQESGAL